jgi:hypothetical protein
MSMPTDDTLIIGNTQTWLTRAVIGLQLCPFAKAVHLKNQIRYVVSHASEPQALLETLVQELQHLVQADPQVIETTLLIHPEALTDFLDYNDFLDLADAALLELDLDGVLQIASFHPRYQFAGTEPDAIENHTNRSPYPMLHLLREESVSEVAEDEEFLEQIPERNMETLRKLGVKAMRAKMKEIMGD